MKTLKLLVALSILVISSCKKESSDPADKFVKTIPLKK